MNRVQFIVEQMTVTRQYSLAVLQHTDRARWFEMPGGAGTHIAWHVGHLVFAQYAHFAVMICPETPADREIIPRDRYFSLFAKGTTPQANAQLYPSADEIFGAFNCAHEHFTRKASTLDESTLDLPTLRPHQIARTRWDMALWWMKHEMLHTGQIALLRRMLGESPWR